MGKERFKRDSSDSFYGDFLYEQVVPKDHFLVNLKERKKRRKTRKAKDRKG